MRPLGARLVIATHNSGKEAEIAALLAPHGIAVTSAGRLGLSVPEETETSFAGNARLKARAAAAGTGLTALSDDSGLEVDALGGAPGVQTADWAETGAGRDFGRAMLRLHDALLTSGAPQPWRARFRCALCLAWPNGCDAIFEGSVEGRIVWPMRGALGHGFDPVFQPVGYDVTFAEMDPDRKNLISHRAAAFAKLIAASVS